MLENLVYLNLSICYYYLVIYLDMGENEIDIEVNRFGISAGTESFEEEEEVHEDCGFS